MRCLVNKHQIPVLVVLHSLNGSMFYINLHAVLPLPMLQIYQTGITFIYTVRFVGDRWDEGEVERSKTRFKPPPPVTFVTDRSKAVLPSFP